MVAMLGVSSSTDKVQAMVDAHLNVAMITTYLQTQVIERKVTGSGDTHTQYDKESDQCSNRWMG